MATPLARTLLVDPLEVAPALFVVFPSTFSPSVVRQFGDTSHVRQLRFAHCATVSRWMVLWGSQPVSTRPPCFVGSAGTAMRRLHTSFRELGPYVGASARPSSYGQELRHCITTGKSGRLGQPACPLALDALQSSRETYGRADWRIPQSRRSRT